MAYFFEKIKARDLGGNIQSINFNINGAPSFSNANNNYGNLLTTGTSGDIAEVKVFRSLKFENGFSSLGNTTLQTVNINNTLSVSGNISTNSNISTNGNILMLGRINNLLISSPINKNATFNANLTVGTTDTSGSITIASNTNLARTLTLNRSLTIEAANANTIVYNASNTSLGAVPDPTVNGDFVLSQKRVSGVVDAPQ
jgi:hypothetical protein